MKMKITIAFLFCSLFVVTRTAHAQNLVPNPSFDIQDSCPAVSDLADASPWFQATLGTPDLYNSSCSFQNWPGHTGIGCAGVFCLIKNVGFDNAREYCEAPLNSALTAGKTYYVSFWVQQDPGSRLSCDRIGAYFSKGAIINNSTTNVLPYTPQVDNPSGSIISAKNWTKISGSFVATGGEDHILIGNFYSDNQTDSATVNSSAQYHTSFFFLDDIYTGTSPAGIEDIASLENQVNIYPTPASDNITVEAPASFNITSYKLLNATGQEVAASDVAYPGGKIEVSLQQFPAGIYFLTLQTEKGLLTKKVVVSK